MHLEKISYSDMDSSFQDECSTTIPKDNKTVSSDPQVMDDNCSPDSWGVFTYSEKKPGSHESFSKNAMLESFNENRGTRKEYYKRLYNFYSKYNPQKLSLIEEYLKKYRGDEEHLFAVLVGKYGPEPEDTQPQLSRTVSICSNETECALHYSGKRCRFPKYVSPKEGNTDCETPYWGGSNLISDNDILSLLLRLDTQNIELQKCYMGIFAQHPINSWNGMTYITRVEEIAAPHIYFLGHIWVATLGSGKVLFHNGRKFQRFTLYCSEKCQKDRNHERWRLSVYRSENNPLILLRTIWDPIVVPEPLPLSRSNVSEKELNSTLDIIPSQLSSMNFESSASNQSLQPEQPMSAFMLQFNRLLGDMEARLLERISALEQRVIKLETKGVL